MKFTKIKTAVFLLPIAAATLLGYAHLETYWVQIAKTEIKSADLPTEFSGKKITFISDLHCQENFDPKRLGNIATRINSLKPDIIILGGDYIDRDGKFVDDCFSQLATLDAPLGKFGILGNHDIEAGFDKIKDAMVKNGITPLVNENRQVAINGRSITIAGVDETWYGNPDGAKTMQNAAPFTVYIEHDPSYFEKYYPQGADLLLAGHTHGGQVTLFGIPFASLIHRHHYKYEKGVFNEPGRTVIVSNGIGATVLPLRFFCRPQINLITLKKRDLE